MECVKQVDDKPTGGHSYSMVRREVSSDHADMAAIKVSIILLHIVDKCTHGYIIVRM